MNKEGYTWEDLDKAWWEGFDNAKSKMEKRIAELEQQIEKMKRCENCVHHYIAYDTTSCRLLDQLASEKPCEKWEME